MIVECRSCQTRFQLDEGRIPAEGIRVRCSRCKEAFFLPHPSQAASGEPPDALAGTSAAIASAGLPATAPEPAAPAGAEGEEIDEEDWEFSEQVPGIGGGEAGPEADSEPARADAEAAADPAASEAQEAGADADSADDGFFGAPPTEDGDDAEPGASFELDTSASGLALDTDDGDVLVSRDTAAEGADAASPFDARGLGSQDDAGPSHPPASDGEDSGLALETGVNPGAASFDAPSGAEGSATSDGTEGENWDFFAGDDGHDTAGPASSLDWSDDARESAAESSLAHPAFDIRAGTAPNVGDQIASGLGLAMVSAGWVAVLSVLGLALWAATGAATGSTPAVRTAAIGALRAEALRATWVDTERMGTVLVIDGQLRNPSPTEAVPGVAIEVVLLDAEGQPISRSPVIAGAPHPRDALRAATQSALRAQRQEASTLLAWTAIAGGESAPFEAVLMDVPHSAARYDVRAEPLGAPFVPEVPVPLEAETLSRDAARAAPRAGATLASSAAAGFSGGR